MSVTTMRHSKNESLETIDRIEGFVNQIFGSNPVSAAAAVYEGNE